jgi:hypothetical protein
MNAKISANARKEERTASEKVCESGTNPCSQLVVRRALEIFARCIGEGTFERHLSSLG